MRNQERTSDCVSVIPKRAPRKGYANQMMLARLPARLLGERVSVWVVIGCVDMDFSQKISGRRKYVPMRPPAKKPATAINEGNCRSARPEIA